MPPVSQFGTVCATLAKPTRIGAADGAFPKSAVTAGYASGWVVVRYDITNGRTSNASAVASSPALFEPAALRLVASMEYPDAVSATQCVSPIAFRLE
jgi:hypothetical protein